MTRTIQAGPRTMWLLAGLMAGLLALSGCKTTPPEEGGPGEEPAPPAGGAHSELLGLMPGAQDVGDWTPAGEVKVFTVPGSGVQDAAPLSADLGDRQAVLYQTYGYVKSATGRYQRGQSGETLILRVFQMESPAEAFGIYSVRTRGTQFPTVGLSARMTGKTLGLVKDRYFVWIEYQGLQEASTVLLEFGHWVADQIASRGYRPAILESFPVGSVPGERYYLHHFATLSILPFVPKGDLMAMRDALGLTGSTGMAIVGYRGAQPGDVYHLFAVQYATSAEAQAAYTRYTAYLDASALPAEKNVTVNPAVGPYLAGTFDAEENSVNDRLAELLEGLGG